MKRILVLSLLALAACTDADMAQFRALGTPCHIVCYSMGTKIFDGNSTGIVSVDSDGNLKFNNVSTGRYTEVNEASCIIEH